MISNVEGYLLNTTTEAYNGRDANKNGGSKCPKLITCLLPILYCHLCPRGIYVSLSVYGTVLRISTRLSVPSITGAAGHQLWWEPLHHGRGRCCKSGPLVSFFFGEPLFDIDQADWARWANQVLPLGIWNWGLEGSTGLGFSIAAHTSLGLQAEGRRKQGRERGWPPRG
ncbi:unnamed protein product [Rangifer tarandus platyrhynchus]|uniref:Uncharacterized protein n=1 Tax=Rangifer tarandus platyrhynchus TaxID=3082113 RepID=A0ABN8XP50_RANTA|nr:unnamed protein product [Rangifer tarandus platyrhynchus]